MWSRRGAVSNAKRQLIPHRGAKTRREVRRWCSRLSRCRQVGPRGTVEEAWTGPWLVGGGRQSIPYPGERSTSQTSQSWPASRGMDRHPAACFPTEHETAVGKRRQHASSCKLMPPTRPMTGSSPTNVRSGPTFAVRFMGTAASCSCSSFPAPSPNHAVDQPRPGLSLLSAFPVTSFSPAPKLKKTTTGRFVKGLESSRASSAT